MAEQIARVQRFDHENLCQVQRFYHECLGQVQCFNHKGLCQVKRLTTKVFDRKVQVPDKDFLGQNVVLLLWP